jgi:hypothetical protein
MDNLPDKVYATIRINGIQCPVTNMFDIDNNELMDSDTLDKVYRVVALAPDGSWVVIDTDYASLWPLQ